MQLHARTAWPSLNHALSWRTLDWGAATTWALPQTDASQVMNRLRVCFCFLNTQETLQEFVRHEPNAVLGHDLQCVGGPTFIEPSHALLHEHTK